MKNKLKALSQLLGKLADKALASLPAIRGQRPEVSQHNGE